MDGFSGRKEELQYLEKLYAESPIGTCAVYGRRRIGKTTLIEKFCEDKKAIIFPMIETSEAINLDNMHKIMTGHSGKDIHEFRTFIDALNTLKEICSEERTVIVFDELPYLVAAAPYVPSALQHFIDRDLPRMGAFLIVCGSSIATMRTEIGDYGRPLYGRFVGRMEIGPLPLRECATMHPNVSDTDILRIYMTVGGIPLYHRFMNRSTYKECIKENFLGRLSFLAEEARGIVDRELSPVSVHSSILSAVARGSVRLNEIAEKAGVTSALCGRYIGEMEFLGIMERVHPMADAPKRPMYRIMDNLVRFHYSVIERNPEVFTASDKNEAYSTIEHSIDTFLGVSFEDVCADYIRTEYTCKEIGKWWGRIEDSDVDIDILAQVTDRNEEMFLFCECKFRRQKVGFNVLNTLESRSEHVKGPINRRMVIFSASGFEDELIDYAAKDRKLILVGPDELFGRTKSKTI
ncbi:MAG: ATP-binding protein [Candidatus Methanoplasma sp.]|jgi:AAA+ ATPase superfamily predicted ATPase|nr:ATP-binding protein [Candidatus Methanoplasma sp.]